MAHVRQQIRESVATLLTGLTTTGSNVFQSRVYPLSESKLPGLLIYTTDEVSEYLSIAKPRMIQKTLTVTAEIFVKAVSNYDDLLDDSIKEVEAVIHSNTTLSGLVKDLIVTSVSTEFSGEGDQPLARATVQIEAFYVIIEGNLETSV